MVGAAIKNSFHEQQPMKRLLLTKILRQKES